MTQDKTPNLALRALKNSAWSMINYGWPLLVSLLITPLMVAKLGDDLYGVLQVVGITLGFFGILDLGIGGAATRQVAAYTAKGEHDKVNRVISTFLGFYLVVGTLVGLAILALSNTFVTTWLTIPKDLQRVALTAFYIAGPSFLVTMVNGVFSSIPGSLQRYDVATKVGISLSVVSNAVAVTLLWMGKGIVELQLSGLIIAVLTLPLYYAIAKRLIPTLKIRPHADFAMLRELFSFGGWFLLSSIAVMLLYQMDKLLVGSMLGVAAVTFYTVPSGLARQVQGLTAAATNVIFPMSAELFETDRHESLAKLYLESTRMVYILVTIVAVPLAVFADKFLGFWIRPEMAEKGGLAMVLLVVTYYLLASTSSAWGIANGSGHVKINGLYALFMAAADLGLFFILVPRFGVPGAAASYLIAACVGVPVLISTIERVVLKMSGFEFAKVWWRVGLTGAVQVAISLLLRPLCAGFIQTVAVMAFSGMVFVLLYRLFGFVRESDRELLRSVKAKLLGQSAG